MEALFSYIIFFSLAMARPAALMMILPVFTRLGLTGALRAGIALALSLPLVSRLSGDFAAILAAGAGTLLALLLKEMVLGFLLGLIFGIPFWAAQSAGDIVDTQRGSSIAYMVDPTSLSEVSITGTFLELALVVLFFVGGGPHLVIGAIYQSEQLWPIMAPMPVFQPGTGDLLLGILDRVLRGAILFGGPLVMILFIVEAVMALISRMAPQLPMSDLSLTIKNIAVFLVLPIYIAFFISLAKPSLGNLSAVLPELGRFLQ